MSLPTPTNRIETYLAYLCGENIALPEEPLNNIEKYLAKICEESVELPSEPLNDIETLLAIKCDETHEIAPYMPLNRIEAYLLKWIGESEELPEGTPLNNIEAYLEHLCNEQPQVVIKIITGLFPLSMQDSSESNAVSLKVMGKTKKAIVIDGERYTYPATINLHNYVTFNGTAYVKTPISAYTNKGKFDIVFSKDDGNTRFLTGQNPSTTSNHIGIWTSSNLMIQNGANTRITLPNIGTTQHTLLVEDGKITFDGTETVMASVAEFTVNQDLYIGGATDPTTGAVDARCFKGDLAHYFHKNSNGNYDLLVMGATQNGVVGLYDFISQTFLAPEVGTLTAGTNATVELVGVGDSLLPSGYTQLEYIESSETQYIDTGIVPSNKKIGAVIDFQFTNTSRTTGGVFGSNKTDGSDNCQFTVYNSKWRIKINSYATYGANYDTNRHIARCNMPDGTSLDDTVYTSTQYTIASGNTNNVFVGACNYGSGSTETYTLVGKLYSAKVYDDTTLVRDFIPAKNSSNVVGMYDLVTGTFFTNAGTGTFTAGPEKATYKIPILKASNCGCVDLGSLTWSVNGSGGFVATERIFRYIGNTSNPSHIFTTAYDTKSLVGLTSGTLGIAVLGTGALWIKDSQFANATLFKNAMSGVYLYYQRTSDDTWTAPEFLTAYRNHEFYNCGDYADEIGIVSGNDIIRCGTYRFDGTENWILNGGVAGLFQLALSDSKPQTTRPYNGICAGFTETQKAASLLADRECSFQGQSGTNGRISIKCLAYENDLAGFKTMLSTLNANGTPISAIVQKATETTETADPLTIPLAYGTNIIDVNTEVEPSSGTLEYYGRGLTVVGGDVDA